MSPPDDRYCTGSAYNAGKQTTGISLPKVATEQVKPGAQVIRTGTVPGRINSFQSI